MAELFELVEQGGGEAAEAWECLPLVDEESGIENDAPPKS